MLSVNQIRSAPNRGRYLFHNPVLHGFMRTVDSALEVFHKPSREPLRLTPRKILVCCQAHIGDTILATSVIPVLKAAFPKSQVGFLIHPGSADVLAGNPRVDWVHTFEHWRLNRRSLPLWRKLALDLQSRFLAIREIRRIGYDLAIDLYPYFPNSIPLLFCAGIPVRLGWTSAGFGGLLTHGMDWEDSAAHVVEWHKRLLGILTSCREHLGLARTELYSSDDIRSQWRTIAEKYRIPDKFIAFHVGAGGIHRRWPTENWKRLAELCLDKGLSVVLLGHGEEERAICREIAEQSPDIHDLSGQLPWRLMSEAISQSQLLVGLKSASGHIAAARNIPVVSIYSGTTRTSVWRPFHPSARVVVSSVPCSPCYLPGGCEGMECLRSTNPETVYKEIDSSLSIA